MSVPGLQSTAAEHSGPLEIWYLHLPLRNGAKSTLSRVDSRLGGAAHVLYGSLQANCSWGREELQFSSLLSLDGFTLMFHTTALICTRAPVTCQSCAALWKGICISGAFWLRHVDGTAGETFLQVSPRLLVY